MLKQYSARVKQFESQCRKTKQYLILLLKGKEVFKYIKESATLLTLSLLSVP